MTKKNIKANIEAAKKDVIYYTETIYTLDACKCYLSKAEVEKMAEFHKKQLAMCEAMLNKG